MIVCKFTEIKISETEEKDGKKEVKTTTIFKHGQKLENVKNPDEKIRKAILFGFDSIGIELEEKKELDNILSFFLSHEHSNLILEGYACVIGKEEYNNKLSQERANSIKEFFANGKLDPKRIKAVGWGEVNPTDDKEGRDNIKYKDESIYKESRSVFISFYFDGHDADTLVYNTIAPSKNIKKPLTFDITEFQTDKCFREEDKHEKKITLKDIGQIVDKGDTEKTLTTPSFVYEVYSDLSRFNAFPLQYFWPEATTPNKIYAYLNSCRYYSNKEKAVLLVNVYPDIKWALTFFLNLTNDLSVKWMNMDPYEHKELQKRAGKMGAEKRWQQKEASIGFSLKAEWDKTGSKYNEERELKHKYEAKFKKLYDIFSSVGALSEGITNKTKGKVRSVSPKGIPVSFAVKPPNLELKGEWLLNKVKDKSGNEAIGTDVDLILKADPLIGLEITVDLLGAIVFVAGSIVGAAPGVVELYKKIQGKLKDGIDVGNDDAGFKANVDIYMDLIISNTIQTNLGFKFNTVGKREDSQFKIEAKNTLKVELKVGVKIKGEFAVVTVKANAYFEASASGEASITFGHGINYDDSGLYYRPQLGFDGLNAEYIIYVSVGLAMKIAKNKHKIDTSRDKKWVVAEGKHDNVIPPFDVIKELEQLFNIDANIPLIRN